MSKIVAVENLVKRYGPRLAVRDVSFAIEAGEVIGLLGPNGSGKSTILRMLTGFLPPSAGHARIAGIDVAEDSLAVRMRVGYVPEDAPLYDGMRVHEFLSFMAAIKGVPRRATPNAVRAASEQMDLGMVLGLPIGKLSRGYRQRVAIAQALVNDPPLLILDEPTNALDAYQVIEVRTLIRSLSGRRTVLVASHVLSEIERVASRVMILLDGELLTTDAMRASRMTQRLRLRIAGPAQPVLAALRNVPGIVSATPDTSDATAADTVTTYLADATPGLPVAAKLARAVVGQGFGLVELTEVPPDLERVFLDLTQTARTTKALAA